MDITTDAVFAWFGTVLQFLWERFVAWSQTPNFFQEFATVIVVLIVLHVVRKIVVWSVRRARKRRNQRGARLFDNEQKNIGHRRAGNRCEFSVGTGRCKNKSEHGDHFYPHSKGGATTMQNFVAACAPHNLAKGAKMPSAFEKARIERRRMKYFPLLASRKCGEWA